MVNAETIFKQILTNCNGKKKMKKIFFLFLAGIISMAGIGQKAVSINSSNSTIRRPKLVVGIVVDQMRWDYLYRYYNRYGNGGFKRMLNEGYTCENTMINYMPSVTAVGHSSIFTGSVPAIHGITDNYWIEQLSGKERYCTDDSTVQGVGADKNAGKMSPRNLLVTTVTDELRMATNFQSKVVGISLKDRAAIFPAGHAANAAFWFDDASGNFITSTYYMQVLPDWVNQFNSTQPVTRLIKNGWNTLYPIDTYQNSDSDNQVYEGMFDGEKTAAFPHNINDIYKKNKGSFRSTPFGNTITLDFAKQAIEGYRLGEGKATDFLTINCASTDYVGHMFGPNSIEVEDTYLRLDQDLAKFFEFLDNKIGKGQYTVFLTADHGVAHTTGYMQKHRLPAGLLNVRPLTDTLNKILANKFGIKELIRSEVSDQVNFDMKKINSQHLDFDSIKMITVRYLREQPGVAFAVDITKINETPIPNTLKTMILNGYYFRRSSPIKVILNPGWFEGDQIGAGTGHGTLHPYDTHIPLLFMGWGIHHGSSNATVDITDIAPTISALLHIQMPNGSIGHVIEEVLK